MDTTTNKEPATDNNIVNDVAEKTPVVPVEIEKSKNIQDLPSSKQPKNPVWAHFDRKAEAGQTFAVCKICKHTRKFSKGSANPAENHLQTKHLNIWKEILEAKAKKIQEDRKAKEDIILAEDTIYNESVLSAKAMGIKGKGDITRFFTKYSTGDQRQKDFDRSVVEYLVEASLPFAHVESDAFKNFVAKLEPRANVKSAVTFAHSKLPRLYDAMKFDFDRKTTEELRNNIGVAFTTDCWTSRANDAFMSVTLHYISPKWTLERLLVGCLPFEGRHTAVRLAMALDTTIKSISALSPDPVKAPKTVVHDAAANMKATITQSQLKLGSFVCMDHGLQTALAHAFDKKKDPKLAKLIKKATRLASRCHQSALTCEKIRDEAKELGDDYVKIVAPVATRWNSNHMMISSILRMENTLVSLKEKDIDIGHELFDEKEFWTMRQIELILAQFSKVSEELSADKSCTVTMILSNLYNLTQHLLSRKKFLEDQVRTKKQFAEESKDIIKLADNLMEEIEKQWADCGSKHQIIKLGHFLHPFFRGLLLKQFDELDQLKESIVQMHPSTQEFEERQKEKEHYSNGSEDLFTQEEEMDPAEQLARSLAMQEREDPRIEEVPPMRAEINLYSNMQLFKTPEDKTRMDVLKWWQKHETNLPLLSHFAKQILCIPASSASSERTFSAAGNIVTAKRYNLDPKTTEMLTFCQQNWKVLKRNTWKLQEQAGMHEEEENAGANITAVVPETQASSQATQLPNPVLRTQSVASTASTASHKSTREVLPSVGTYHMTPMGSPPPPPSRNGTRKRRHDTD